MRQIREPVPGFGVSAERCRESRGSMFTFHYLSSELISAAGASSRSFSTSTPSRRYLPWNTIYRPIICWIPARISRKRRSVAASCLETEHLKRTASDPGYAVRRPHWSNRLFRSYGTARTAKWTVVSQVQSTTDLGAQLWLETDQVRVPVVPNTASSSKLYVLSTMPKAGEFPGPVDTACPALSKWEPTQETLQPSLTSPLASQAYTLSSGSLGNRSTNV